jgi:hypothetical protein
MAEVHWYEAQGIGRRKMKIKRLYEVIAMKRSKTEPKFALCLRNEHCEDLVVRKVYQVIPDEEAAKEGYLRILDESGEDYLYPEAYFVPADLPREASSALAARG